MADVVIEGSAPSILGLQEQVGQSEFVFAEPRHLNSLTQLDQDAACKSVLIVHNGDVVDHDELIAAACRFQFVYSVNWLGTHPKIHAIPIGLENSHHNKNGRPQDFAAGLPATRSRLCRQDSRDITLLVAFNPLTNPGSRLPAKAAFHDFSGVSIHARVSPKEHRHLLQRSLFVLSPPGNGQDCHRTWEAIYLGAIPVVLDSAWPFSDVELPVLTVKSWEEARAILSDDPRELYESLIARPASAAYFPHYLQHLLQTAGDP